MDGEIVGRELNKTFVYIRSVVYVSRPQSGNGGSQYIRFGVPSLKSDFPLLFPSPTE